MRNRSYHFKVYPQCFIASEFTDWMISRHYAVDRTEAVKLGKLLVEHLHIVHVTRDHDFKDQHLFFKFMSDTRDKGHVLVPENG